MCDWIGKTFVFIHFLSTETTNISIVAHEPSKTEHPECLHSLGYPTWWWRCSHAAHCFPAGCPSLVQRSPVDHCDASARWWSCPPRQQCSGRAADRLWRLPGAGTAAATGYAVPEDHLSNMVGKDAHVTPHTSVWIISAALSLLNLS